MRRSYDKIVSLGQSCTAGWQLRTQFPAQSEAYPFDWLITPFDSLCAAIETDLKHFDGQFEYLPVQNAVLNTTTNILHPHDFDKTSKIDPKKAAQAVEKFRFIAARWSDLLASDSRVLFIRNEGDVDLATDQVSRISVAQANWLCELISKKAPQLRFSVLFVSAIRQSDKSLLHPRALTFEIRHGADHWGPGENAWKGHTPDWQNLWEAMVEQGAADERKASPYNNYLEQQIVKLTNLNEISASQLQEKSAEIEGLQNDVSQLKAQLEFVIAQRDQFLTSTSWRIVSIFLRIGDRHPLFLKVARTGLRAARPVFRTVRKLRAPERQVRSETAISLNAPAPAGSESSLRIFDERWYLATYPDVSKFNGSPKEHFLSLGYKLGYNPHPLFDTRWYLKQSPAIPGCNPVEHYLEVGAGEGRQPHPLFDGDYYLAQNPDVKSAGINALVHFIEAGIVQGRNPFPLLDAWHDRDVYEKNLPLLRKFADLANAAE